MSSTSKSSNITSTEKKALQKRHYAAALSGTSAPINTVPKPVLVQPGWLLIQKERHNKDYRFRFTFGAPVRNAYLDDAADRAEAFKDKCILERRILSQRAEQEHENERLGDLSRYYNATDPRQVLNQDETDVNEPSRSDEE
jgi:hypothetical protein